MSAERWQTDDYFVSPWNYQDEVRKDFTPPARVSVHDVTLRPGVDGYGDRSHRVAGKRRRFRAGRGPPPRL
jgi:hypothetical protein